MNRVEEDYFKEDENVQNNSTEFILDKDESVLLKLKPKKGAYIFNSIFTMLPIALVWLLFDGFFIGALLFNAKHMPVFVWFIVVPFFLLHLTPVWIWLAHIIKAAAGHKNLEYVFTEKRIIIRSGAVGIDFNNTYYSEITGVNLRVGLIDRLFKVGDLYITAKDKTVILYDITNPYFILKKIQNIVIDLKTDVFFPNDLRPAENHGFKTKYRRDKENFDN